MSSPSHPGLPPGTPRFALCNGLIAAGFVVAFPLSFVLPLWVSWENSILESLQNWTMLAGIAMALLGAQRYQGREKALLWIAALFWLAFLGREMSWGAVFLPPTEMTEWGPSYRSKYLPYRGVVPWVVGAMALLCVYWFVSRQLWSRVLVRLTRERAWPVVSLLLFAFGMVMSTNAEDHGFLRFQTWYDHQVMVLEELVENFGYAALLLAQWQVLHHMLTRWSGRSTD